MAQIEIGKTYVLYGRIGTMKRMKPVGSSSFVTNLIYADLYTPSTELEVEKMLREIDFLKDQGTFEFRKVAF